MADDRKQPGRIRGDTPTNEDELRRELRRDPEFEMPDPEQVDRDIDQARRGMRRTRRARKPPRTSKS